MPSSEIVIFSPSPPQKFLSLRISTATYCCRKEGGGECSELGRLERRHPTETNAKCIYFPQVGRSLKVSNDVSKNINYALVTAVRRNPHHTLLASPLSRLQVHNSSPWVLAWLPMKQAGLIFIVLLTSARRQTKTL